MRIELVCGKRFSGKTTWVRQQMPKFPRAVEFVRREELPGYLRDDTMALIRRDSADHVLKQALSHLSAPDLKQLAVVVDEFAPGFTEAKRVSDVLCAADPPRVTLFIVSQYVRDIPSGIRSRASAVHLFGHGKLRTEIDVLKRRMSGETFERLTQDLTRPIDFDGKHYDLLDPPPPDPEPVTDEDDALD